MQLDNLTDEELMQLENLPNELIKEEPEQVEKQTDELPAEEEEVIDQPTEDGNDADGAEGDGKEVPATEVADPDLSDEDLDKQEGPKTQEEKSAVPEKQEPAKEEPKPSTEAEKTEQPTIDYQAEYLKLVGTPIKANGREITLKDTDEVLRLVQQGANYAKRMEELKPARKTAAMLESAGLLGNEQALSHMIDLYNGNPQAIAKMVKDLNIDIYALDLDAGAKYTPTSHLPTDEAVNFQETLKEVRSLDGGLEAMRLIDSWDQMSKDMIWGNAAAVRQIYEYKQAGIYDTVANELERRRTLGQIPEGTPFIVAFQQVGEELAETFKSTAPSTAPEQRTTLEPVPAKPVPRTPVATGVAPRKTETPDARAIAAASPRGGAAPKKSIEDIYALSDDDILKMQAPPV